MPVQFAQAPTNARSLRAMTGTGVKEPPNRFTAATSQAPVIDPNTTSVLQVLGSDAVVFTLPIPTPAVIVTFPNLPKRNNTVNPLIASTVSPAPLSIAAKDHLLFYVFVQNANVPANVSLNVTAQALARGNIVVPGPFLGSNVFTGFRAVLSVNAPDTLTGQVITGVVCGTLHLSVG